jgi:restriction system protein
MSRPTVRLTQGPGLFGTMQHEGATLSIVITTSGYSPASVEFANGKPLHLIDGHHLLDLPGSDIPARILGSRVRRRAASKLRGEQRRDGEEFT